MGKTYKNRKKNKPISSVRSLDFLRGDKSIIEDRSRLRGGTKCHLTKLIAYLDKQIEGKED